MSVVTILIGENYYTKDPQSSELGRNIVASSIELMDELGFEQFTFKKLALKIHSTEASIYRYFDNKHKLLVYLTTWYWAWVDYMIDYRTHHIEDQKEKLEGIIRILCHADTHTHTFQLSGVNTAALRSLVVSESDKTYLTKKVDEINSEGLFKVFKDLCHKIALVIKMINPKYPYPHAIVSTILEASHQQAFFALHLPSLTEISAESDTTVEQQVFHFIHELILKQIE